MQEIWSFCSHENHQICCHQMSDFKLKMHQIQFRLGLCPRPRWGSLSAPPDPLAAIGGKGVLLLRGGKRERGRGGGREGKREGREGEREGSGKRRERGWEGSPPLLADHFNHWPTVTDNFIKLDNSISISCKRRPITLALILQLPVAVA